MDKPPVFHDLQIRALIENGFGNINLDRWKSAIEAIKDSTELSKLYRYVSREFNSGRIRSQREFYTIENEILKRRSQLAMLEAEEEDNADLSNNLDSYIAEHASTAKEQLNKTLALACTSHHASEN